MIDLKGYTILITGAASGNGYGISSFCSDYFSKLILVDKNEEALNKAKENLYKNQTLKNKNINIDIFKCDLSCKEEINLLIQKITDSNMPIHCLVNNAGITLPLNKNLNLHEKLEIWDKTLKVNLTAPYHLSIGLEHIIPPEVGTIINITSLNSTLAFPNNPSYMASKGGLRQLTMSLAMDLSFKKIRVNSIAPGYFKTNMTKISWEDMLKREERSSRTLLNRWGMPDELGGTVCFLASNLSSYITGQEIYVDGGWSIKGL